MANSLQSEWNFIQRVTKDATHLSFDKVKAAIRDEFIPALFGKDIECPTHAISSQPVKGGGTGILDPSNPIISPYDVSCDVMNHLSDSIANETTFTMGTYSNDIKSKISADVIGKNIEVEKRLNLQLQNLSDELKKTILRGKSTGSWLSQMPLEVN